MYLRKNAFLKYCLYMAGVFSSSLVVEAKEVLSVEQAILKCKTTYPSQFESKKRLACFDSISTPAIENIAREAPVLNDKEVPALGNKADTTVNGVNAEVLPTLDTGVAIIKPTTELTYLERKWRLTSQGDWDISDFETYKSNYLLVTSTNHRNDTPFSPSQNNLEDRNLDAKDLKFQLSLKTEMMNNIPLIRSLPYVTSSRIWGAYTQQSYWQVFDSEASRPLRENDYEPEIILSLGIDNQMNGIKKNYIPRMLNLGLVHQSNGQSDPISRSWNRVYLETGWELTDQLSLMVRPWWRIPESTDDNPDIEKFMGYGDMTL